MIIMAVDLGDARTGLAVSDKEESFAFPAGVIHQRNTQKLVQEIICAADEKGAEIFVVGLPKNMDGTLGFRAEECTATADLLKEKSGREVVLWDERCTTVLAHTQLSFNNVRGKKRKDTVDTVAAVLILESYLNFRKNNK